MYKLADGGTVTAERTDAGGRKDDSETQVKMEYSGIDDGKRKGGGDEK